MMLTKILLIIFTVLVLPTIAAGDASTVGNKEMLNGLRLDQYANAWWQWAYSMPASESPIRDKNGEKCNVNQKGDVWYLAGGFGTSLIRRKCEIPAGKHIFFPIINMAFFPSVQQLKEGGVTCQKAMEGAAANNDNLDFIEVVVDGKVYNDRKALRVRPNECFDISRGVGGQNKTNRVFPAATDGYWMMLKPLSKGEHTITFAARYTNPNSSYGSMIQLIEYKIHVGSSFQHDLAV